MYFKDEDRKIDYEEVILFVKAMNEFTILGLNNGRIIKLLGESIMKET